MFSTAEFWVLIAFLLLLGGIGKRAFASLTKTLDDHRQKIADQVEEAQRLHDEALSLLNSYKKKSQEAKEQAEKLLAFAEVKKLAGNFFSGIDFIRWILGEEDLLERVKPLENYGAVKHFSFQNLGQIGAGKFSGGQRVHFLNKSTCRDLTRASLSIWEDNIRRAEGVSI